MDGFLVEIHGEKEQEFLKSQIKFLEVRRLLSLLLWSSVMVCKVYDKGIY